MDIHAYKMDGLGNDFVIIDNRSDPIIISKDQIIKICDRKFIGCDQLILINNHKTSDAHLKFFNSDGLVLVEMEQDVLLNFYPKKIKKKIFY